MGNIKIKELIEEYPLTKGYIYHGFVPTNKTNDQILGNCLFCFKKKMYVNINTGQWYCQRGCGDAGGSYFGFLKSLCSNYRLDLNSSKLKSLAQNRGLSRIVLYNHKIAFNPVTEEYLIPELYQDKIIDVKRYKNKHGKKYFYSSPNVKKYLWLGNQKEFKENIILLEGEWDFFTAYNVFKKDYTIVMLPGATAFKEEYSELFTDKNVYVFLDNDRPKFQPKIGKLFPGASAQGNYKIYQSLSYCARSLKFKHWDNKIDGYDIRDLWWQCGKSKLKFKKSLFKNMHDLPQRYSLICSQKNNQITKVISYEQVYEKYNKWLILPDNDIIDAVYGTIFANRLKSDPLWLFLVAKSGFAKTVFLMALNGVHDIHPVSFLTPSALVSGVNTKDNTEHSLIYRINNKTLVIKDFTTFLGMDPMTFKNIFTIFRDAYDGNIIRATGYGEKNLKSKFGILTGVTPAIYDYVEENTAYGERFLMFRCFENLGFSQEYDIIGAAIDNAGKENNMRKELQETSANILSKKIVTIPELTSEIREKVIYGAMWLSAFRGVPKRSKFGNNDIQSSAQTEIGTRPAKQIKALLKGIAIFKDKKEVTKSEFDIVNKIILSSANLKYKSIFDYIIKKGLDNVFHKKELINHLRLGTRTGEKVIEDMVLLNILKKDSSINNNKLLNVRYKLTNKMSLISNKLFTNK